jgi:hypothetical protein
LEICPAAEYASANAGCYNVITPKGDDVTAKVVATGFDVYVPPVDPRYTLDPNKYCSAGICKTCKSGYLFDGDECINQYNIIYDECGDDDSSNIKAFKGTVGVAKSGEITTITDYCSSGQLIQVDCEGSNSKILTAESCPSSQVCSGGICTCPSGTTLCGSSCVDTSTDSNNCGGCGSSCGAGKTCSAGTCPTTNDNAVKSVCASQNCDNSQTNCQSNGGTYMGDSYRFYDAASDSYTGNNYCCGDDSNEKVNYYAENTEAYGFASYPNDKYCCPYPTDCIGGFGGCYRTGYYDEYILLLTCRDGVWTDLPEVTTTTRPQKGDSRVVYEPKACTDNDGGMNFFEKGTVSSRQLISSPSDYCSDASTLMEYYCVENEPSFTSYTCPSGYSCSDGACVPQDKVPPTIKINSPVDGASYKVGTKINSVLDIDVKDNSGIEPSVDIEGNKVIETGANPYTIIVKDGNGNQAKASFIVYGR